MIRTRFVKKKKEALSVSSPHLNLMQGKQLGYQVRCAELEVTKIPIHTSNLLLVNQNTCFPRIFLLHLGPKRRYHEYMNINSHGEIVDLSNSSQVASCLQRHHILPHEKGQMPRGIFCCRSWLEVLPTGLSPFPHLSSSQAILWPTVHSKCFSTYNIPCTFVYVCSFTHLLNTFDISFDLV